MRALLGIAWFRLMEWAETVAPELGDWLGDDDEDDQRQPGEAFCSDCPDHEACATAWPCWKVKEVARDAANREK